MYQGVGTNYLIFYITAATELQMPTTHILTVLREIGKKHTRVYELTEFIHFILFVVSRLLCSMAVLEGFSCEKILVWTKIVLIFATYCKLESLHIVKRDVCARYNVIKERWTRGITFHWWARMSQETLLNTDFYIAELRD